MTAQDELVPASENTCPMQPIPLGRPTMSMYYSRGGSGKSGKNNTGSKSSSKATSSYGKAKAGKSGSSSSGKSDKGVAGKSSNGGYRNLQGVLTVRGHVLQQSDMNEDLSRQGRQATMKKYRKRNERNSGHLRRGIRK